MTFRTLISPQTLFSHLRDPHWVVVDCRFWLDDPEKGRRDYRQAHIPGAVYAHLDEDLSAPPVPGRTGRHPLPEPDALAAHLTAWGIGNDCQVVAYDDRGGAIAARLWFLLRWLGHDAVAVLDGGFPAWEAAGLPTGAELPAPQPRPFTPRLRPHLVVAVEEVEAIVRGETARLLCDSRTPERYRGEQEPLDPVAGHIPGAPSLPYPDNLGPDGRFLPVEQLRARFLAAWEGRPAGETVFYCGSGVTAAHNLLAVMHAGLGEARLYAGSWSEWITDPRRPIATGAQP